MARTISSLLIFFCAFSALADTHEVQTVELVQVPVYVSRGGAAVRGLTRENFELTVNGRPQPIEYFDVIDFATTAATQQRVDPQQRRLYVLVFDLVYSSANEMHRAQRAAYSYLDTPSASDVFAIATCTATHGVDIVVPFTRDRIALRQAVAKLNASYASDPLHLQVVDRQLAPPPELYLTEFTGLHLDALSARAEDQLDALRELATTLTPIEGQKHVVLLSSGFNSILISGSAAPDWARGDIRNAFFTNRPLLTPQWRRRGEYVDASGQVLMSLRQLAREYGRAGVFLDAIDIAGLRPFGSLYAADALYALADATGGSVVTNRNDLERAMEVLSDTQRVAYVLSFRAMPSMKAQNRVSVRLRDVGGRPELHYRQSFTRTIERAGTDNALHLADVLLNDTPQTGIPVESTVTTNDGRANVAVSIGGRELAAQLEGDAGVADVMMYVFSGTSAVAFDEKKVDIDLTKAGAALREKPIRFDHQFQLPPGRYSAKILVRLGDDSLGFSRTDFTIAQ